MVRLLDSGDCVKAGKQKKRTTAFLEYKGNRTSPVLYLLPMDSVISGIVIINLTNSVDRRSADLALVTGRFKTGP